MPSISEDSKASLRTKASMNRSRGALLPHRWSGLVSGRGGPPQRGGKSYRRHNAGTTGKEKRLTIARKPLINMVPRDRIDLFVRNESEQPKTGAKGEGQGWTS